MNSDPSTLAASNNPTPSTPRSEWSNRGHKLAGADNPNLLLRRQLWSPTNFQIAEDNFKVRFCRACCIVSNFLVGSRGKFH